MAKLIERYRPATLDEVKGQDKAVAEIRRVLDAEGWGGQAWWLSGPTGTGKTTLARIVARMGAVDAQIVEVDAGDVSVETLREMSRAARAPSMFGGRAWIVNEAHALRGDAFTRLLTVLEEISDAGRDAVFFTTTWAGRDKVEDRAFDAKPFIGRCNDISLTNQGLNAAITARLREIADAEGIDADENALKSILKATGNTFREAIQALARLPKIRQAAAVA